MLCNICSILSAWYIIRINIRTNRVRIFHISGELNASEGFNFNNLIRQSAEVSNCSCQMWYLSESIP